MSEEYGQATEQNSASPMPRNGRKYCVRNGHNNFLSDDERRQMIERELKLPEKIARSRLGIRQKHPKYEDVVSAGYVGLLQAADRYNPNRGASFSTFATDWVFAAQRKFLYRDFSIVPLGWAATDQNAFYCLLRVQKGKSRLHFDAPLERIAQEDGIPEKILEQVKLRLNAYDRSIDDAMQNTEQPGWYRGLHSADRTIEERAVTPGQEERVRFAQMFFEKHYPLLTEDEQWVIEQRYFSGTEELITLKELGEWMTNQNNPKRRNGVSRARVHQIEKSAMRKLREAVKKEVSGCC